MSRTAEFGLYHASAAAERPAVSAEIEGLQAAIAAASAEVRSALFYYGAFGLYFGVTVAGTTHEHLLRGAAVAMPGLGVSLPAEGFYALAPPLFIILHLWVWLQLAILAHRVGALHRLLTTSADPEGSQMRQLGISPFAITQWLLGLPPSAVSRLLLQVAAWAALVFFPLLFLIGMQMRFLPYHSVSITWLHRIYVAIDLAITIYFWCRITGFRRIRWRERRLPIVVAGLIFAMLIPAAGFASLVVASVPDEKLEHCLLEKEDDQFWCQLLNWLGWSFERHPLPDGRTMLGVTYRWLEAPDTPLGLRRNIVVRNANLVVAAPSPELEAERGMQAAWREVGSGINLRARDLRFADLSGSDLSGADLRGADLHGAVLAGAKLVAVQVGDIPEDDVSECLFGLKTLDSAGQVYCRTRLSGADLSTADLRGAEGWKAELRSANLSGANLEGARLEHSTLTGAILKSARLSKAVLWGADLRAAVMLGVVAPGANLTCADLKGTLLKDAELQQSAFAGVDLNAADLRGSSIDQAILRATSDCDPENGSEQAVSLAWADLPELALPLLHSEYGMYHLTGIAGEQQPLVMAAEARDPERVQVYELGLAKELAELVCSDGQDTEISAGGSLAEGIARRIAAEYRHQDSQTPGKENMTVRDSYFVVAGFLLFGRCNVLSEAEVAEPRRTLDHPDVRELERLRCLWIGHQDDYVGARHTLLATWFKWFGSEEQIPDVLAPDLMDEARRCREQAALGDEASAG